MLNFINNFKLINMIVSHML